MKLRFSRRLHQHSSRTVGKLGQFHRGPIVLQLVTPNVREPEPHEFSNPDGLVQLVQSFNGTLRATKSDSVEKIISPNQYKDLDPSYVYEIVSPMFGAAAPERRHSQVSDKAFEDKCRLAFIRFLDAGNLKYSELSLIVKDGDCIVAEWEAIFDVQGGDVYLLECKHSVTAVSITFPPCANLNLGHPLKAK